MALWKRNLAIAWVTQVLSLSGFGFVIPFLPYYLQQVGGLSEAQMTAWAGYVSSAPALTMALMAPVWGHVADRFGRKLMLLRAMGAGAILMALMGYAQTPWAVVGLRAMQGLFTGTIGASAALVSSGTPEHRMGSALGFLSSSTFVGLSLGPMFGGIAAETVGYRATFLIGGVILAIGFILVVTLISEPEGLRVARRTATPARAAAGDPQPVARRRLRERLAAMPRRTLHFILLLFGLIFALRFVRTLAMPFLPLHVQQIRGTIVGTPSVMGLIQAAAGLATAIAGVTIGRLGDRMSRATLIVVLLVAATAVTLPIAAVGSLGVFAALYVATTFFLGGIEPTVQSELVVRSDPARRGMLFGIQTTVGNTGWATAPLVGSAIGIHYGIQHIFTAIAGVLALTAAVTVLGYGRLGSTANQPPAA